SQITATSNLSSMSLHDALPIYSLKKTDENSLPGIKTEMIYDASGRVVASRIDNENWNCTNYDDRGRVQSKVIASNNSKTGKTVRSEEHTSELQSRENLVCRLLL